MAGFQNQIGALLQRLTTAQKLLIAGVTIGCIAAIVGLVALVNRPSYGTLFSNLNPQDASKIVEKLREKNVPYQLEDGGKTILVSKEHLYDMRLSLAGEGLPQSSIIGYEIFDRTNLGVSDFVQKVNYRRALEGELARTILQLDEVEAARVHIVVPGKALFKEDEKSATASVVLKLKSGKPLNQGTTQGIAHLIASSIEGLEAANVTIIDTKGALLSENNKPNSLAALSSTQYELQRQVEEYLCQKAQSMLEGVVGIGNARVQVNAELDFRQVDRSLEHYDPENTAIRSEQLNEEKTTTGDSSSPSTRSNTVTNYEINKSIEHIVENVGNIKRLSVAALVNGTQKEIQKNGEKTNEYVPRPQQEMDQLTDIVKRAVGFNPQRNDEVSMVNLPFETNYQKEDFLYKDTPFSDWYNMLDKVFVVIAMVGALIVLRSLLKKFRVRVGSVSSPESSFGTGAEDVLGSKRASIRIPTPEEEIPTEVLMRTERRKHVAEYIQHKPEEASRLLKVWLAEE